MSDNKVLLFYILLVTFILSSVASSAEIDYTLGVGITSYDNINLVLEPTDTELARSIQGSLNILDNSDNLTSNIRSSFESINYNNNLAEDETTGRLFADALYIIKPNIFEWHISDIFTQTAIDQLAADSVNNRQDTNVFSTGPNYTLRFNPNNNLNINARGEDYRYEINAINNRRINTDIILLHQANSSLNYSITHEYEKVNFSNDVNNYDYYRNDLFLSSDYSFGSKTIELEYGITEINSKSFDTIDEYRYLLALDATRSSTSSMRLNISHSTSDTASDIMGLIETSVDDIEAIERFTASSDVFAEDEMNLVYNKEFHASHLLFDTSYNKIRYNQIFDNNNDQKSIIFRYTWNLHSLSTLMFDASSLKTHYVNQSPNREDDRNLYRLIYTYNTSRHMYFTYIIASEENDSNIDSNDYSDLRLSFTITYSSR